MPALQNSHAFAVVLHWIPALEIIRESMAPQVFRKAKSSLWDSRTETGPKRNAESSHAKIVVDLDAGMVERSGAAGPTAGRGERGRDPVSRSESHRQPA